MLEIRSDSVYQPTLELGEENAPPPKKKKKIMSL